MSTTLLLFAHHENARLLREALATAGHTVIVSGLDDTEAALRRDFDVCIADALALELRGTAVRARKAAAHPLLLPVLLVGPRQEADLMARYLHHTADEWLGTPIQKAELLVRVETLLRLRDLARAASEASRLEGVLLAARTFEHELGNKLVPTLAYTERLAHEASLDERQRRRAQSAYEGARDAARIIRRVLELTQRGSLQHTNWGEVGDTTIDVGDLAAGHGAA